MGDGRAEGSSAIGDGGQAAISLMPDADGTHVCIFESSKLEGSYVGNLQYIENKEQNGRCKSYLFSNYINFKCIKYYN